ncbi:OmpA/MotB family protein [Paenibacillus sanguinis]|uniref:OmpA family protein n=1 Tax=Paenibacillus sanguinis TaxID=225906 RepID=UPI00039C56D1
MITYADLITLLLIFFVVMYGMSQLDVEKYEVVTTSLQQTFMSSDSVLELGSGITGTADRYHHKNPTAAADSQDNYGQGNGGEQQSASPAAGPEAQAPLTERELAFRQQEQELASLMGRIESYIQDNQLEEQIKVTDLPKGISITLSDQFLFDIGKAELKAGSEKALSRLASLFKELNTIISIEGHTDDQPIKYSAAFKDNWELSGARALSVLRFFLEKEHLDPQDFQYAGYADTRPAADNDTPQGRQKNRRVEITVLRQLQQ